MIYPSYSGTYPQVTMRWNGAGTPPHWVLRIFYQNFTTVPFNGINNIPGAGYGYVLYITAIL
jgi:hypothetical protein